MILGKRAQTKLALDGRTPRNLSEWLEVATWNLVPSAKARGSPEIETHFAEAMQNNLQNGMAESAAQAAALADLGDADAAAGRFRREYLTIQEMNKLRALHVRADADEATEKAAAKSAWKFWRDPLISTSLWLLVLIILAEYAHPMDSRQVLFLAVSLLALPFAAALHLGMIFVWVRKMFDPPLIRALPLRPSLRNLKLLVLWAGTFTLLFVAFPIFLSDRLSHSFYFPIFLMVGFVMLQALASVGVLSRLQRV